MLINFSQNSRKKKQRRFKILSALVLIAILSSVGFFIGNKYLKNNTKSSSVQASKTSPTTNTKLSTKNSKTEQKQDNNSNKAVDTKNNASTKPVQSPKTDNTKSVYLTFDDGPSTKITPQILKVLRENNVKASFFLIGKNAHAFSDLVKQEKAEGHAVCNHTYSHNYGYIYSSTSNFLKDIQKADNILRDILGTDTNKIIRFPGGGFYKKRAPYRDLITSKGYKFIDWTVETGDARTNNVPPAKLISNLKYEIAHSPKSKKNNIVVLMHDLGTKQTTVDALPEVINLFKSQGYTFKTIEQYPFK